MWNQAPATKNVTTDAQLPNTATPPALPAPGIRPQDGARAASIGKSVTIKGDLIGSEDLTIDGQIEGRIELKGHSLLIGPNAKVQAAVTAKVVTVMGTVIGNITAEKVDIRKGASIEGDIDSQKVAMAEGAQLSGRIDTLSAKKGQQRQSLSIAV
jgi:cytoskeletal protein CcmA (bactofilin family)